MTIPKNGFHSFNDYNKAVYKISSNKRGRTIDTVSLWIGTYLFTNTEDYKSHTRKLSRKFNNFFSNHSKDGYYRDRFILIEHYPDSLKLNGKGYISFEPFLFLQEDYTREFVHSYVLSLFQEIDEQILCDTPEYIIRKAGKNKLLDQNTNYHSI
jgi:hypothetical protein